MEVMRTLDELWITTIVTTSATRGLVVVVSPHRQLHLFARASARLTDRAKGHTRTAGMTDEKIAVIHLATTDHGLDMISRVPAIVSRMQHMTNVVGRAMRMVAPVEKKTKIPNSSDLFGTILSKLPRSHPRTTPTRQIEQSSFEAPSRKFASSFTVPWVVVSLCHPWRDDYGIMSLSTIGRTRKSAAPNFN